jgi:hypothetical protein
MFVFVTWLRCYVSVWASEHPHMTGVNTGNVTKNGQVPLLFFVQDILLCYRIERQ